MASINTRTKRSLPYDIHESDDEVASVAQRVRTFPNDPAGGSIAIPTLSHDDYTIVWVCALSIERAAAEAVLDEEHESLPPHGSDDNIYTLGSIAGHKIVVASLPEGSYGVTLAASVLANTRRTFPNLRHGLIVGIGGGVPGPNNDIRLGDVVVGTKVTPYGPAKVTEHGRMRTEESIRPEASWMQVLSKVRSRHERTARGVQNRMAAIQTFSFQQMPSYHHPRKEDNLFLPEYNHITTEASDCRYCDTSMAIARVQRPSTEAQIHYGTIASGDDLMKHGIERERLRNELDILCFEMEAAGLMDAMRCLPVRGIADYADSHKNKAWQRYAAANAAAFAKEVIELLPLRANDIRNGEGQRISKQLEDIHSSDPAMVEARTRFLESLKFERFDVRRRTVRSSYRSTCQWLLRQSEYRAWLDTPCTSQHRGFLWIKGNPGTGKSTLMKFAFEEESLWAKRRERQRGGKEVVASFFFNARGNDMEQSVEGMYRALIHQILQEFADLQGLVDTMNIRTIFSEGFTIVELEDLFKSISTNLNGRRVTCFVDALDEGGRKQVVEMVKGFQDLFEYSTPADSQLRICFSSRHYPYIRPRLGLQLTLEELSGHSGDLEAYVLGNLEIGNPSFKRDISTKLLEKAHGIFLWTALVVDYLNEDISKGLPVEQSLSARLEQVPEGLHQLFQHLLARDPSDMSTFRLMVSWLLFSREPLSPRQVDHALWSGSHGDMLRNFAPPTFDEPDIEDRIRKRVITASKGLAEVTATEQPTVQFIHESARDFLLQPGGLEGFWRSAGHDEAIHYCNDLLKDGCEQYLNHPLIIEVLSLQRCRAKDRKRHEVRRSLLDKYPLLQYACQNVLWHADVAAYSLPQEKFLSGIDITVLKAMLNAVEFYGIPFYGPDHDLLSIIANRGHAQLIRGWTGNISIDYTFPIVAAIAGQQETAFTVLMEKTLPGFHVTEYADLALQSQRFLSCENRTILMLAAQSGCDTLVERLLQDGARVDDKDEKGESACDEAVCNDDVITLRLIIRSRAGPLWSKNELLPRCIQSGSEKCATWLVNEGADVNFAIDFMARGESTDRLPALHMAAAKGMLSTIQAIIKRGVDVCGISADRRRTPLHIAVLNARHNPGRDSPVETLLENGANVNAVDSDGQTPLMAAYFTYYSCRPPTNNVIEALFRYGAGDSINWYNHLGQTAIMLASKYGEIELIHLLRGKGANCRVVDQHGRSLFWYVHTSDFLPPNGDEMFRVLSEWGIQPSINDGSEVWSRFHRLVPLGEIHIESLGFQP